MIAATALTEGLAQLTADREIRRSPGVLFGSHPVHACKQLSVERK